MTSLSTLSAGLKPPKVLSPNRYAYTTNVSDIGNFTGSTRTSYTGGSGNVDIVTVTGAGAIQFLGWQGTSSSTSWSFTLTIDGVSVASQTGVNAVGTYFALVGFCGEPSSPGDIMAGSDDLVPFNKSFTLTIASSSNAYSFHRYYTT